MWWGRRVVIALWLLSRDAPTAGSAEDVGDGGARSTSLGEEDAAGRAAAAPAMRARAASTCWGSRRTWLVRDRWRWRWWDGGGLEVEVEVEVEVEGGGVCVCGGGVCVCTCSPNDQSTSSLGGGQGVAHVVRLGRLRHRVELLDEEGGGGAWRGMEGGGRNAMSRVMMRRRLWVLMGRRVSTHRRRRAHRRRTPRRGRRGSGGRARATPPPAASPRPARWRPPRSGARILPSTSEVALYTGALPPPTSRDRFPADVVEGHEGVELAAQGGAR